VSKKVNSLFVIIGVGFLQERALELFVNVQVTASGIIVTADFRVIKSWKNP